MATKPLISRNARFSKFREHVRRWAFRRTKTKDSFHDLMTASASSAEEGAFKTVAETPADMRSNAGYSASSRGLPPR